MSSLSLSKKAQFQNYAAVIVFIFIFGILSIFAYLLISSFISAFTSAGVYTGVLAETGNNFLGGIALLDNVIIFIAVLLIISVGVTSFKLASAPIFFIITLIMGFFFGFVGYFFSFTFIQIVSDPVFTFVLVNFPRTLFVCANLHWLGLIVMIVGSITLYAKRERGQFLG